MLQTDIPEQRAVSTVQSTLATTTSCSSALLYFSANSCHVGANFLQCPHLDMKQNSISFFDKSMNQFLYRDIL